MADAREEPQQPEARQGEGDRRDEIRSLPPDERVRRARELAEQMRRQRAAERAAAQGGAPAQPSSRPQAAETPQPQPKPAAEAPAPAEPAAAPPPQQEAAAPPSAPPTPAAPPTAAAPGPRTGWRLATGPAQKPLAAVRAEMEATRRRTPVAVQAPGRLLLSRRTFILGSFWSGLGLSMATFLGGLDFLFPRKIVGFGGPIPVPAEQVPKPGDPPIHIINGKFWLVNLKPDEGKFGEYGELGSGGLLALWQKCPHLGCTVPWRGDFVFGDVKSWFRCPCHGSTYTRAGIRVFGPSPRPMDTMKIEKQPDGSVVVQTGQITSGANDNPTRTVPYP